MATIRKNPDSNESSSSDLSDIDSIAVPPAINLNLPNPKRAKIEKKVSEYKREDMKKNAETEKKAKKLDKKNFEREQRDLKRTEKEKKAKEEKKKLRKEKKKAALQADGKVSCEVSPLSKSSSSSGLYAANSTEWSLTETPRVKVKKPLDIRQFYEKDDDELLPAKKAREEMKKFKKEKMKSPTQSEDGALNEVSHSSKSSPSSDSFGIDTTEWLLSKTRRVKINDVNGKRTIDIRQYYEKDGESLPGKKGISLTLKQWEILLHHADKITAAIKNE